MAQRGSPLPFALRQLVREYIQQKRLSQRRTALLLDLHRATVKKYGGKNVPPEA